MTFEERAKQFFARKIQASSFSNFDDDIEQLLIQEFREVAEDMRERAVLVGKKHDTAIKHIGLVAEQIQNLPLCRKS